MAEPGTTNIVVFEATIDGGSGNDRITGNFGSVVCGPGNDDGGPGHDDIVSRPGVYVHADANDHVIVPGPGLDFADPEETTGSPPG